MSNFWDNDPVAAPTATPTKSANFWEADPVADHPSIAADVAKSGGVGLAKGAIGLAGAPGDLSNLLAKGSKVASDFIADKLGLDKGPEPAAPILPTNESLRKNVEGVTGEFYKPQTVAGHYAETAGEFAPAVLGGGEGLMAKLATRVAAPAAASETAGQLTKGTAAEPYARIVGALSSPAIIAAGRRAITPLPASAERAALADTLRGEGVDLTAGQTTGSRPLQWAESTFGDMPFAGGRPAQMMSNQGEQFTAAALRRAGETADRATPEVIDGAFRRIGQNFDDLAARNWAEFDPPFVRDLQRVHSEYTSLVPPSQRAPVVDNLLNDITNHHQATGGVLTGEAYQAMRSRIDRLSRQSKNDPQLSEALSGIRGALDDVTERTIAARNPADLGNWREARNQYRNLMVLEKAATGAGSNAAEGLISPSQLRNAVVQQNRRSYARGRGDFADLARSGEALLKPLPQTGTAPRQNMQHALSLLGGGIGGAAGGFPGAAAGIAAPAVAGRVLMSRPIQAYLGNQALLPGARESLPTTLSRALVAARASREAVAQNDRDR